MDRPQDLQGVALDLAEQLLVAWRTGSPAVRRRVQGGLIALLRALSQEVRFPLLERVAPLNKKLLRLFADTSDGCSERPSNSPSSIAARKERAQRRQQTVANGLLRALVGGDRAWLDDRLDDPHVDPQARARCADALASLPKVDDVRADRLAACLDEPNVHDHVALRVAQALHRLGDSRGAERLVMRLEGPLSLPRRRSYAQALARIDPASLTQLFGVDGEAEDAERDRDAVLRQTVEALAVVDVHAHLSQEQRTRVTHVLGGSLLSLAPDGPHRNDLVHRHVVRCLGSLWESDTVLEHEQGTDLDRLRQTLLRYASSSNRYASDSYGIVLRLTAATALARWRHREGFDVLRSYIDLDIAERPTTHRILAALELETLGPRVLGTPPFDGLDTSALSDLLDDLRTSLTDSTHQLHLARVLVRLGDERGAQGLLDALTQPYHPAADLLRAIDTLVAFIHGRYPRNGTAAPTAIAKLRADTVVCLYAVREASPLPRSVHSAATRALASLMDQNEVDLRRLGQPYSSGSIPGDAPGRASPHADSAYIDALEPFTAALDAPWAKREGLVVLSGSEGVRSVPRQLVMDWPDRP